MKKGISFILLNLLVLTMTSCLKMNLEELPVYESAEISNLRFEYRWWDENIKQMRVVEMGVDNTINTEDNELTSIITVPTTTDVFTQEIRDKVTLANLVASLDISTAASVKPTNGSPILGIPEDFSKKEFTYLVTAADGITKKEWKIKISEFKK